MCAVFKVWKKVFQTIKNPLVKNQRIKIYQQPAAELKNLNNFNSDLYEMKIRFSVKHTEKLSLHLRCNQDKFANVQFQVTYWL